MRGLGKNKDRQKTERAYLKSNILYSNYSFNFIMAKPSEQFLIPQLNLNSSQSQLKQLQKRMLSQFCSNCRKYYDEQTKLHNGKYVSHQNPQSHAQMDYRQLNKLEMEYEKNVRNELAQNYREQAERKANLKRIERERKIQEEKIMLENMQRIQEKEKEKKKEFYLAHKKEVFDGLKIKEKQKSQERQRMRQEKEKEYEKYKNNSSQQISKKKKSFQQHFQQVNGIRNQIQKNYIQKWSPQIRQKQDQKNRIIFKGIQNNEEKIKLDLLRENEEISKTKNIWKEALIQQIKEKQKIQQSSRAREQTEGYTSPLYHSRHHPINNPVDFKIGRDNRYIMNELKSEGGDSSKMSGLARSGSHALLS